MASADYLWLFGGRAPDGKASGSLYATEAADRTSTWRKWWQFSDSGSGPRPRYGHASAGVPRRAGLIIVGGAESDGAVIGDAWVGYVLTSGNASLVMWNKIETPPLGALGGACMAVHNDLAYLFGGRNGTAVAQADLLTLQINGAGPFSGTWKNLRSGNLVNGSLTRPQARDGSQMASSGGGLYLFGGRSDAGEVLGDLWHYRPGQRWYDLTGGRGAPARYGHAMVGVTRQTKYLRDKLFVYGGRGADSSGVGATH